jgi:hypothetical protein
MLELVSGSENNGLHLHLRGAVNVVANRCQMKASINKMPVDLQIPDSLLMKSVEFKQRRSLEIVNTPIQ